MKVFGLFIIIISFALTACGRITVTGKVNGEGQSGNFEAAKLTITRGDLESVGGSRLKVLSGRPEGEILQDTSSQLRVDVTGRPNDLQETYHFVSIVQAEGAISGGTSNERNFVVNNVGRIMHLSRRRGDVLQETALNGRNHVGTTLLAIVQDNDRIVPWRIEESDSRCMAVGEGDCLDMETISRQLFQTVSNRVNEIVREKVPLGSMFQHKLHFVPRVVHNGFEAQGRRARGFAFIYSANIQVPTATIEVFVPLSVLFVDDIQNYVIVIDPIGLSENGSQQPENLNRILVKGSLGANLFEGAIRDNIVNGIKQVKLPQLISGVEFESTLLTAFNIIAGATPISGAPPRISQFYEVILLPEEDETNLNSTTVWRRGRGTDIEQEHPIRLVFLE